MMEKMMKEENDKLLTLVHLENTDQEKCGSLVMTSK